MDMEEEWGSVERWTGRLAPVTARKEETRFRNWMKWMRNSGTEFAGYTPDQLVAYQRSAPNGKRFEILDQIVQPYILSMEGRRYNTKNRYYTTIRSFFKHNRAPLPSDPDFRIRGDTPQVRGTLTVEELRDVIHSSKPIYRAVFLCMFQGALDLGGFNYWNLNGWKETERQLEKGIKPLRIDLPGRKSKRNIRPYYTLIGNDAVEALRLYVENHRPRGAEVVFISKFGTPLKTDTIYQYWLAHLRKIGAVGVHVRGRRTMTGKNPHEMRDLFRSMWEKSPAKGSVAEFCMGHVIDPLEYNKAFRDDEWVRDQYLNAEPWLNIISSGRPFGQVDKDEVTGLNRRIYELQAQVERLRMGRSDETEALTKRLEGQERKIEALEDLLGKILEKAGG